MIIMNRGVLYCIGLCLVIVVLFASNLLLGSVSIPAEDVMRILWVILMRKPLGVLLSWSHDCLRPSRLCFVGRHWRLAV